MPEPKHAPDKGVLIILVVTLVVAVAAGLLAFNASRNFFAASTLFNFQAPPVVLGDSTPTPTSKPGEPTKAGALPTLSVPEDIKPVQWDGTSRVTVLVMGLDYRDWQEGADIPRTDTMILFSIDPMTKTAGMLSIPRDMWVNIPDVGYSRINTAYRFGEAYKLPGGGMALAAKTVENFIGVPVDYVALIDFNAFVQFIDALGGLDMHIKQPIKVDPIGPGKTIKLMPGVQTLDGQTVLAYARNRYTQDGDFDRSNRQQEVILALRDQIIQFNQLPMLVANAPTLYEKLSSGIRTTLTLDQVIKLAWLAVQVDKNNIHKAVFDPHKDVAYASVTTSDGKADILVPVPDQIRLLRDQVFVTGGPIAPGAGTSDLATLMKDENARVMFYNGTGTTENGQRAGDTLKNAGMQIVGEQNANQLGQTTIIDHTGKPYTLKFIIDTFKLENARVKNDFNPSAPVDVEVTVGTDIKLP